MVIIIIITECSFPTKRNLPDVRLPPPQTTNRGPTVQQQCCDDHRLSLPNFSYQNLTVTLNDRSYTRFSAGNRMENPFMLVNLPYKYLCLTKMASTSDCQEMTGKFQRIKTPLTQLNTIDSPKTNQHKLLRTYIRCTL